MTPEPSTAMAEMTGSVTKTGKAIRFKLHDKVKFLDRIMRNLGLHPAEKVKDGFVSEADQVVRDAVRKITSGIMEARSKPKC